MHGSGTLTYTPSFNARGVLFRCVRAQGELTEYERKRLETIKTNRAKLHELLTAGMSAVDVAVSTQVPPPPTHTHTFSHTRTLSLNHRDTPTDRRDTHTNPETLTHLHARVRVCSRLASV